MLGALWRFFVALFDVKTLLRRISRRPTVDVVFITNMRDEIDRKRFLGKWIPPQGHFNGPRYWFNGVIGRTRAIDVTARDLMTSEGRKRAKKYFLSAVEWAHARGARVVLLAAGTKRLFGTDGKSLKERFPDMLFTIGDNGTASLLCAETLAALVQAGLTPESSRVLVIGPNGILGKAVTAQLLRSGYSVVGLSSRKEQAKGIETYAEISEVGYVDAVVACAHAESTRLTKDRVGLLRKRYRKLLVVDVAEPSNMSHEAYQKCHMLVVRQDAGNAYSSKLSYVLGAVSYRLFRLTRGVTFGCFAEAMTLAVEISRGTGANLHQVDWFTVTDDTVQLVADLFKRHSFTVPAPRCFGRPVTSFEVQL